MYIPAKFNISDPAVIRSFVEQNSFGLLLSTEDGVIHDTHTPFVYSSCGGFLVGHIACANPHWKSWINEAIAKVVFTGPHSYISPHYYVSEFAVPTWNYSAVSISGHIEILTKQEDILIFLDELIRVNEKGSEPWALDRSDERYIKLIDGIVVFRVAIDSVEASFKMNQNKGTEDQLKVMHSLSESTCPFDNQTSEFMKQNESASKNSDTSTPHQELQLQYIDCCDDDFNDLVELRIEAMRESLEKIGRFDRERSIDRFRSSFIAKDTTKIFYQGDLVGFYSLTIKTDHLYLGHLYVRPRNQSLGIGSLAIEKMITLSSKTGLPIRLGALKQSESNHFYQKHGFVKTTEDEWDIHYERVPNTAKDGTHQTARAVGSKSEDNGCSFS